MSALNTTPTISASRAYWTTQELATRYGIDRDTVYGLATTGGLPHIRIGREYRFPIDRVLAWEEQRTITSNSSTGPRRPRAPRPNVKRPSRVGAHAPSNFTPQPYAGPLRRRAA